MENFESSGLSAEILRAVKELGFETPTPIQSLAIPCILSGNRDLIASAQTGTGKTAAFGLPLVQLTDATDRNTQALILCPTRELCVQITRDLDTYCKYVKGMNILAVYGGSSIDTQIRALNKGAQIVVATPGRAMDLIKRKKLMLGNVVRVVLDEADEMLSMGFQEDLDSILSMTSDEKQTLLFSATMSKDVRRITKKYMHKPEEVAADPENTAAENVQHQYYMVHASDRYELLKRIADMHPNVYGIVFCRTRRDTADVANKLMNDGYNADALHGDMSQAQRDDVMGRFRSGQLQMLVATDVAARGLDVNDLTHVINYNLPDDPEVYVHRSGRTGRAGKNGISIAIIHMREGRRIQDIERLTGIRFRKEKAPSGQDICTKQLYALIDKIEKVKVDEKLIEPFLPAIYDKLAWLSREELIKHFVSAEFNRFLAYYKNSKDLNVESGHRNDERGRQSGAREDRRRDSGSRERRDSGSRERRGNRSFTRLFINIGEKNQLNPARLIGLVNEGLGSRDADIGKIDIMKKFSFFEVGDSVAKQVIQSLKGQVFEGVELEVDTSQEKPDSRPTSKGRLSKRRSAGFKKTPDQSRPPKARKESRKDRKGNKRKKF